MKIVVNACYGGFGLSAKGVERFLELSESATFYSDGTLNQYVIGRSDPALVQTVLELGSEAGGSYSRLAVVDIPDDVDDWYIVEYDGYEHVAEGRTWHP